MATVVGPIRGALAGADTRQRVRVGSVEPAVLALLEHLDPLIVVLVLLGCKLAYGELLTRAIGAAAVLAFVVSGYVFNRSNREGEIARKAASVVYPRILFEWACVVAILLFAGFAFNVGAHFSRLILTTWFCTTPVALCAVHALRSHIGRELANSAYAPRYIIIGANGVGVELFRRLPHYGFMGFFDFRSADRVAQAIEPETLAGHCKDVAEYARSHNVNAIYITLPLSNVPRIGEMMRELQDTTASIYFVPDVFAFDLIRGRLVVINGMPALAVCDTPFHGMDAVLKRATDIAFGLIGLALTAPLMALIALGVKLSSPGPILFRQRRYGLNGEEITVYKFRSMTVCEDGPVVAQATKQDPRVTQIFNVLEGKMSVVGPRPHAVAHNELYRKLISGYMIRHKVRPGITGLAQVNGLRGETETVEKMRERVKYDLEYLTRWSPWLDFKIILKTMGVLWRGRGAY
jgi:putative colanic acid biosysnthesis UDP-glucose lipid carrier transferase